MSEKLQVQLIKTQCLLLFYYHSPGTQHLCVVHEVVVKMHAECAFPFWVPKLLTRNFWMARKYKPQSKWKVPSSHHHNLFKVDCSIRHLIAHYKKFMVIRNIAWASYCCAKITFDLALLDSSSSTQKLQTCYNHFKQYKESWLEIKPLTALRSTKVDECKKYFLKRTQQTEPVLRRETFILLASNSCHCLKLAEVFNHWPWIPLSEPKEAINTIVVYFVDLLETA